MLRFLPVLQAILLIPALCIPTIGLAADVLTIDNVAGNAGDTNLPCFISATHDQAIEGFASGLQYNPAKLTLTSADFQGTAVSALLAGADPDFAGFSIDNVTGIFLAGVIFEYGSLTDPPSSLPSSPTDQNSLLRMLFTIDTNSLPQVIPIQFSDQLGDPPVLNVLSAGGVSVSPQLIDGSVTINNLHRFYFGNLATSPGGNVNATLRYDHAADEIQGFQISLSYDNTILTLQDPATAHGWYSGLDLDSAFPGGPGAMGGIELFYPAMNANVAPGVGLATFSAIFDFLGPYGGQVLPPSNDQTMLRLEFGTLADPALLGTTTEIVFDDSYPLPSCPPGDPNCSAGPALNYVIYDGLSIIPILENGVIEFLDQPGFKRGNTNSDSGVDLADALFIVNWLFADGPVPTCMDSADTNDDDGVDISDTIYLLNYLFVSGPPPPAPGPNSCGLDPSSDLLDCLLTGGC